LIVGIDFVKIIKINKQKIIFEIFLKRLHLETRENPIVNGLTKGSAKEICKQQSTPCNRAT